MAIISILSLLIFCHVTFSTKSNQKNCVEDIEVKLREQSNQIHILTNYKNNMDLKLQKQEEKICYLTQENENLRNESNLLKYKKATRILLDSRMQKKLNVKEDVIFELNQENCALNLQIKNQQNEIVYLKCKLGEINTEQKQKILDHFSKRKLEKKMQNIEKENEKLTLKSPEEVIVSSNTCPNTDHVKLQKESEKYLKYEEDMNMTNSTCIETPKLQSSKNPKKKLKTNSQKIENDISTIEKFVETKITQFGNEYLTTEPLLETDEHLKNKIASNTETSFSKINNKLNIFEQKMKYLNTNSETEIYSTILHEEHEGVVMSEEDKSAPKTKVDNKFKKKLKNKKKLKKQKSLNMEVNHQNSEINVMTNENKGFPKNYIKEKNKMEEQMITQENYETQEQKNIKSFALNNDIKNENTNQNKLSNCVSSMPDEAKMSKEFVIAQILVILNERVPLTVSIKENGVEYLEMAKHMVDIHRFLVSKAKDILPKYGLDLLCIARDALTRFPKFNMTNAKDQYDLFLFHHGAIYFCKNFLQYEEDRDELRFECDLSKTTLDKFNNIAEKVMETNLRILSNILKIIKDGKTRLKLELFLKNSNLYDAEPYKYECMMMLIGQLLYGTSGIIDLL